jgi:ParB-like chromosome segregation protein Spo0J
MEEVPTIELSHLTDTQRKALVIADNKLALNADWDTTLLTIELDELLKDGFALDILGFNEQEIKTIMQEVNFDAGSEEDQGKLDQLDPKWICCPHCGKEFDAREA